jgi:hypothetical protein
LLRDLFNPFGIRGDDLRGSFCPLLQAIARLAYALPDEITKDTGKGGKADQEKDNGDRRSAKFFLSTDCDPSQLCLPTLPPLLSALVYSESARRNTTVSMLAYSRRVDTHRRSTVRPLTPMKVACW